MQNLYKISSVILGIMVFSSFSGYSQNLIQNGGFEEYVHLPNLPGQYYFVENWDNAFGHGSPDYYHLNGLGQANLPHSYVCDVLPYEGSAIMGFFVYESDSSVTDFREYLTQTLQEPLTVGEAYRLSFYITNGNAPFTYGGSGCDQFSVAFSTTPLFQGIQPQEWLIRHTPQYTFPGMLYNNQWQLITYDFIADSAYSHITFGSFVDDETQNVQHFDQPSQSNGVNYFVDDVRLEQVTSTKNADWLEKVKVYPNPVSDFLSIGFFDIKFNECSLSDLSGTIVFQKSLTENQNSTEIPINLRPGIYILTLMSEQGVFSKKIVVI